MASSWSLALPLFFTSPWEIVPDRMDVAHHGCVAVVDRNNKVIVIGEGNNNHNNNNNNINNINNNINNNNNNNNNFYNCNSNISSEDEAYVSLCRVFDASTERWERKLPATLEQRLGCAAVWHKDAVYVMGGKTDHDDILRTVERLVVDHWEHLPPMITKRTLFAAVLIEDRFVLVAGGRSQEFSSLGSVERFDINRRVWTMEPNTMLQRRAGCAGVLVADQFFVFGGADGANYLCTAEAYDTTTRTWEALPDMPCARAWGSAVSIGDRYVLLVGGEDERDRVLDRVDCFDTASRRWILDAAAMPRLGTARTNCAAVCVGHRVYVMGGTDREYRGLDTVERIHVHPYYITMPRLLPLLGVENLPLGLWPHILAGCHASVMYFILCCDKFKLDSVLLLRNNHNRKRKAL